MIAKKILVVLLAIQIIYGCASCSESGRKKVDEDLINDLVINVPIKGNTWVVNNLSLSKSMITDQGLKNWKNDSSLIRTYVRLNGTGSLSVGLKAKLKSGSSTLKVTVGDESKEVNISGASLKLIPVGRFNIKKKGYVKIDLKGLSKSGSGFAEISDIVIGGKIVETGYDFVKDDFYWGRRGPSVHLSYKIPEGVGNVRWFYNEIKVPEDNDVIGSYYMANGFAEGYFGIQVNSETERRILFSVWSPYQTDNPNEIPDEEKIKLLKKGDEVIAGEFGNEGSGGQSYKVYNWKAENTYRFLLGAKPSVNNSTDYIAYFYAPEIGKWELIASFRRPKISTYVTRPHSFLENFITEMGPFPRKAMYSNQWVRNVNSEWFELTEAKFTADATARKNSRLDYAGGSEGKQFYLKNCGFINDKTSIGSLFKRGFNGIHPSINFEELP
ncbi:DUF3472 domain-containing protein [Ancylomarina sp. DW003]|nr:DUF3472 domain-containing protein [Ancylomarina sp. DW003]MDE5422148.1 DUF3472 domain-containing protein [Ancylomarina sp. DW003]